MAKDDSSSVDFSTLCTGELAMGLPSWTWFLFDDPGVVLTPE
jgi:hypothetical protein